MVGSRRADLAGRPGPAGLVALAGALSLGVAALLFTPRVRAHFERPPLTVLLVDGSASVVRTRSSWGAWVRERLAAHGASARAAGSELAAVRFDREVSLWLDPGQLPLHGPGDDRTDLAGAALAASELFDGGRRGRLVLLGDGTFTGADPRPALARLAELGVGIELELPPAPDRTDLALADVRLPRELEPGAPLVAEVFLASLAAPPASGTTVEIEVELAGPDGVRRETFNVLAPGPSGAVQRLDLGAARAGRTEVRVTLGTGDAVPENDGAIRVVEAGDELVVAALAPPLAGSAREDWAAWCAGLARLGGIQVLPMAPEAFASLPGSVDAVVSYDVPLAAAGALGLEGFVAGGGGWLATGGYRLLAGAGPDFSPLLPAEGPGRRVVFLVDGSGSMSGAPFDELRDAVLSVMEVGQSSDRFELLLFTDVIESRHVLGPGGRDTARAAGALLAARPPRGATDVLAALREVAAGPAGAAARPDSSPGLPELLLLLTDGRDQPDPARLASEATRVRAQLAAGGTRLVVVGAGAAQDGDALRALAGDATLRRADRDDLVEVFREEVGLGPWTPRGEHRPAVRAPESLAAGGLAASLASSLEAASPLAPLERVQRTRLGDGAEAVLEGPGTGPALALRRHGRGHVAALASAPVRGFGGEWTARPQLLGPVVRALGRGRRGPGAELRVLPGPGGPGAVLTGVPPDWPALVRARLADGSELRFGAPAEVPGAEPGTRRVARAAGGAGGAEAPGPLAFFGDSGDTPLGSAPWSPGADSEFSPRRRTLGPLGPSGPGGDSSNGVPGPGQRGHAAAPWWLGLGLLLVGLAVALGWDGTGGAASGMHRAGR